ncbi:MAG TPA: IclR family transcriptional regulator [Solirubrobacteraceae bacterium]|jgi:DNA-binding IclR family transcriptional regulator
MGRDGQSVIEKASKVLEAYLRDGTYSLSFAELLERTSLHRTSLHRTLAELAEHGFLTQLGQREEYRLGPLLRSTAALAASVGTAVVARPYIERLRDECRETVVLAELHEAYVVPVLRADGLHEMRMNQEVGRRYPVHAGGTGKALLGHLPAEQREALLASAELLELTPRTVTDREALRRDLELVLRAGVAVTLGERVPEALAISAPVLEARDHLAAALTISGVSSRYERERLLRDTIAVKRTSEAISSELGNRASSSNGRPRAADLERDGSDARDAFDAMCEAIWSTEAPAASRR